MEADFWQDKWRRGEIGFHEGEANLLLTAHFPKLGLAKGDRVFLPLCGKTRDIGWLLGSGYRVAGAELSELAVNELFQELGLEPNVSKKGPLIHYRAANIDIWAGDIFDVPAEWLGPVDATYDRAALVALPAEMRKRYTAHLMRITAAAPQLLITFDYDQTLMDGPPFSVSGEEVREHYAATYQITSVERKKVEGGIRGKVFPIETAWLLQK